MSHYNVDYSSLQGQEKIDAAVADVKGFVSKKQFAAMREMAENMDNEYEFFRTSVSVFCGVSGYPIQALWIHFGREVPAKYRHD